MPGPGYTSFFVTFNGGINLLAVPACKPHVCLLLTCCARVHFERSVLQSRSSKSYAHMGATIYTCKQLDPSSTVYVINCVQVSANELLPGNGSMPVLRTRKRRRERKERKEKKENLSQRALLRVVALGC
jgi:hypothetical protein